MKERKLLENQAGTSTKFPLYVSNLITFIFFKYFFLNLFFLLSLLSLRQCFEVSLGFKDTLSAERTIHFIFF